MSFTTTTPFMNLVLPSPSLEPGPAWATELNAALTLVDSHTHQSGSGQPITTAALSINADLSFGSFNATALRSTRFTDQTVALSLPADIACLYAVNGNLYYNNSAGQQIQLTAGGALNASSIGAIGGDYSTSTASLFYTSASSKFTFWSNTNTPAFIDSGPLTVRRNTASSPGITLLPDASIGSSYSLTLPAALPGTTSFATIGTGGAIGTVSTVQGITQGMLALRPQATNASAGGVGTSPATGSFVFGGNARSGNIVSCNLVTTGRPVWIGFIPATPDAYIESSDVGNTAQSTFYLTRGTSDIAFSQIRNVALGSTNVSIRVPVGSIYTIDFPTAGSQSYTCAVAGSTGTTSTALVNAILIAYEL